MAKSINIWRFYDKTRNKPYLSIHELKIVYKNKQNILDALGKQQ